MNKKRSLTRNRALRLLRVLGVTLCLSTLAGIFACERRPLELLVEEDVGIRLVVKWKIAFEFFYGIKPTGMTVMLWDDYGNPPRIEISNSDSVLLHLEPGRYRMIIFNQTFSEFPYLEFRDIGSFEDIAGRAVSYDTRVWDTGATYMYDPDPIAVAVDSFYITQDMVRQDTTVFVPYKEYKNDKSSIYSETVRYYEIPETPYPMTVNLFVKAKVKRPQSIRSVEASISGMADGFYLKRVDRTSDGGTLKLTDWTPYRWGEAADSMGIITTQIASFGLPHGKELQAERDSTDNMLTFHFTLTNDSVIDLTYKVGKDIRYINPTGEEVRVRRREDLYDLQLEVDLSDVIVLPSTPPTRSGQGFDAVVDEWEDGGTYDLGGF